MKRLLFGFLICVSLGLLAGCGRPVSSAQEMPLLRLPPAALGRTVALQQQLAVNALGREFKLEALLEVDAQSVRLALLDLGQVMARLKWDGVLLEESKSAILPDAISGARVLSDLQLMYWPASAIRQALTPGWTLAEENSVRTLWHGERRVAVITYRSPARTELVHERDGYSLTVDSATPGDTR